MPFFLRTSQKQFNTVWAPCVSWGQVHRWHTPAALRNRCSDSSIPVVWVAKVLNGCRFQVCFFLTTFVACKFWHTTCFFSNSDHFKISLQPLRIWSWISSSEDSDRLCQEVPFVVIWDTLSGCELVDITSPLNSRELSHAIIDFSEIPILAYALRLSICMMNPVHTPVMKDIHQMLWARKMYWLSLAKDIIFSGAYTMTSSSFSKVIGIRMMIHSNDVGLPL
jgi:hypothetical protein